MKTSNLMVKLISLLLKVQAKKVDSQSSKKKKLNLIQMMIGRKSILRKKSLNGRNKTLIKDSQRNLWMKQSDGDLTKMIAKIEAMCWMAIQKLSNRLREFLKLSLVFLKRKKSFKKAKKEPKRKKLMKKKWKDYLDQFSKRIFIQTQ